MRSTVTNKGLCLSRVVSRGLKINISRRCFGKRAEFEDEHHLARSLSRYDIDPDQQKKWKNQFRGPRPWTKPPLRAHRAAQYEHNALERTHELSYTANVLLEIRDVRVPASSHNPNFARLAKHRVHLICYTHADMIDSATRDRVEAWTIASWPNSRSIFVDAREHRGHEHFNLLYDSLLEYLDTKGGTNAALTVGISNTGKSSLLVCLMRSARKRRLIPRKIQVSTKGPSKKRRRLRKHGPVEIEDKPGKTRELTEYLIREKPRVFFWDVPGMTPPPFYLEERPSAWYGLAAANLLLLGKDLDEDPDALTEVCRYVLFRMNTNAQFGYVLKLGLDGPVDDIDTVLAAVKRGQEHWSPETLRLRRCKTFLKLLNTGNFGPIILDDLRKPFEPFVFKDEHFKKN